MKLNLLSFYWQSLSYHEKDGYNAFRMIHLRRLQVCQPLRARSVTEPGSFVLLRKSFACDEVHFDPLPALCSDCKAI